MMKTQYGGISVGLMVFIGFFTLLLGVAGILFASYVSAYNYGNSMEKQLAAIQTDNKNILAQYGQKVMEAVQIPEMYAEDLQKVITAAIEGRYGSEGSRATFQWIQEQNPTLDPGLYANVQQIIESGRTNFEAGQRRLIDVRRQYETKLGSFWSGIWLRIAGYPKVNLSDFDIVSTDRADEAFRTKKEAPLQLRQ